MRAHGLCRQVRRGVVVVTRGPLRASPCAFCQTVWVLCRLRHRGMALVGRDSEESCRIGRWSRVVRTARIEWSLTPWSGPFVIAMQLGPVAVMARRPVLLIVDGPPSHW